MRWLAILGVLLILAGVASLIFNVVTFHHTEQVAKIGPITANKDEETNVVIPPIAGIIAVIAGGALVFAGRRRA